MFGSFNPTNNATLITQAASALIKKGQGQCTGILCATSSTGVIEVWDAILDDSSAGAKKIVDDITLVAGNPYAIPYAFKMGLYVKKISGNYSATVFWD